MSILELKSFYLVYSFGLSDLGIIELKDVYQKIFQKDVIIQSIDDSGVLIESTLLDIMAMHYYLKCPTRILMRLSEFKVRDVPKLFGKMSKFDWKPYLCGQIPSVSVSAHNSRLFDSRKIEKAIQDGIQEFYKKQPIKKKYQDYIQCCNQDSNTLPTLYYRSVDDVVTLSLDLSGELLHKRGDKLMTGLAPIRENLASLLLQEMNRFISFEQKENISLVDPMSGSGTFLIEAHDQYSIKKNRDYAFLHTPFFIENRILLEKHFLSLPVTLSPPLFQFFLGIDQSNDVINQAKQNIKDRSIQLMQHSFMNNKTLDTNECDWHSNEQEICLITNPPYGVRIGDKETINTAFYEKCVAEYLKTFKPYLKLLGIIVPKEHKPRFKDVKIKSKRPFKNGGLDLNFYVCEIL